MSDEQLDRFARGDLSAMEQRELAQASLEDPQLFEELTGASLARRGLTLRRRRRTLWIPVAGLAAAATIAAALLSTHLLHRSAPDNHTIPDDSPSIAMAGPPIFLATQFDATNPAFRSAEPDSRAPRRTGTVTSIADGAATLDLGSLDGLLKGADLEVVRDGNTIGQIRPATVFRERSRAEAPPGLSLRLTDEIRVPPATYLRALLDQIAALTASGDVEGARRMAGLATALGETGIATSSFEDWNNLGGIAEMRGDRAKAQSCYEAALRSNPPPAARQSIDANLARVRGPK